MYFHEAVGSCLRAHGVNVMFGLIGDANLYMADSFRRLGGTYVSFSNEAGAVQAANGYAQATGSFGIATVTHGPGLTNTITTLFECVKAHTPLVLLAGDTPMEDQKNLQDIPQHAVVLPTGCGFEQARSPGTVGDDVSSAIRRAVVERRPIVLNVPKEFQWQHADYEPRTFRQIGKPTVAPDPTALDIAFGVIAEAHRPVILGGRGACSPGARESLLRLGTRIGAPFATTLRAKDLFRGHPHDLGVCGSVSHEIALETISGSDCVVAFGAGLNSRTTESGGLVKPDNVVHVSDDVEIIDEWATSRIGVLGDPSLVADALVKMLDEADVPPTGFADDKLSSRLAAHADGEFADISAADSIDIRTALRCVDQRVPQDRVLVIDGGLFLFQAYSLLHAPAPERFVHTMNSGSIGLGMGCAIGAAYGFPEQPVLLVCGDGGFMLGGLAEFSTAVRHGIDIVVVILNDGSYGAEYVQFRDRDMDPSLSLFDWPEFGPVASALGGQGFTARNLYELNAALTAIPGRDRPVLIDVKINPRSVTKNIL